MEMMLGKRSSGRPASSRHPMRRTTSMTEFAPPDVLADVAEEEDEEDSELQLMPAHAEAAEDSYGWALGGAAAAGMRSDWLASYRARGAGAAAELGGPLGRRDERRVPPRLRALQLPPRPRPRHLHVQGRYGVLQPGVQAAAHNHRGVEGEVHGARDNSGGGHGGAGWRGPRTARHGLRQAVLAGPRPPRNVVVVHTHG